MSERTGTHWWTLTGRLGVVGRLVAVVLALALGAVTGVVWLSPSGTVPGPLRTEAEKQLQQENADLVAIKQSPAQAKNTGERTAGFASAMDAEGIQVIDVYSAFPTDDAALAPLLKDTVNPSAAGQQIWTTTVLKAFEVQA